MKNLKSISIYFSILTVNIFFSCVSSKKLDIIQKENEVYLKRNKILEVKLDSVVDVTIRQKREINGLTEQLSQERAKSAAYGLQVKENTAQKKSSSGTSLSKDEEYDRKANFILNFGKFIFWPKNYLVDKDFIIGVYGKSMIMDRLVEITSGKTINGKKIVVQQLDQDKTISDVHIVFFPESANPNLTGLVSKIKKKPILVITENLDNINKNYMLNFLDSSEKVKFSLNRQNANNAGLNVNLDLMKLSF